MFYFRLSWVAQVTTVTCKLRCRVALMPLLPCTAAVIAEVPTTHTNGRRLRLVLDHLADVQRSGRTLAAPAAGRHLDDAAAASSGVAAAAASLYCNPNWAPPRIKFQDSKHQRSISREDVAAALAEVSSWAGYAPTPLLPQPLLATRFGVADVWCKHEGHRFEVASFKVPPPPPCDRTTVRCPRAYPAVAAAAREQPTGVVYALARVLKTEVARRGRTAALPSTASLLSGQHAAVLRTITVVAATSGNHGVRAAPASPAGSVPALRVLKLPAVHLRLRRASAGVG
eukprot:SAG11_NODE_2746_length_3014_cov_3.898799_3_plen_285_part_00